MEVETEGGECSVYSRNSKEAEQAREEWGVGSPEGPGVRRCRPLAFPLHVRLGEFEQTCAEV